MRYASAIIRAMNKKQFVEQIASLAGYPEQCILWPWDADKNGYGRHEGRNAHRSVMLKIHGPKPDNMVVRHVCKNKTCVNPSHLQFGSVQDNMNDRIRDGTLHRGEKASCVKLSEVQVFEIWNKYRSGAGTLTELGREYGVHRTTIKNIITRKNWRHLDLPTI